MMAKRADESATPTNYAEAFKELENIIQQLESGQPSLEESMKLFECGQALLKKCSKILDDTDLRIKQLTKDEIKEANQET